MGDALARSEEGDAGMIKEKLKFEDDLSEIAFRDASANSDYKQHFNRIIKLGRTIMKYLGPHSSLFLEYETQVGLALQIYTENVYRIGFEDGRKSSSSGREPCLTKCPTKK